MSDEVRIDPAHRVAMGNFQITANMQDGRSMVISGYLFEGEALESINARVDLMQEVIDRQRARCEIPELEAKREQFILSMKQMRDVMEALLKKKEDGKKLTSQEIMNLQNYQQSLAKQDEHLAKGEEAIATAKRKAGMM